MAGLIRGRRHRLSTRSRWMRPSEAVAPGSSDSLIITIGINFPKLNEDKELQAPSAWGGSF